MDPTIIVAIIGAIATIAAAVIGKARGERKGRKREQQEWAQTLSSAPRVYAARLANLIDSASRASGRDVVITARALVAVRDELKRTLVALSSLLNSEMDKLAAQLRDAEGIADNATEARERMVGRLRETVLVIQQTWPSRTDQIDIEIRKLLAELGLERKLATE